MDRHEVDRWSDFGMLLPKFPNVGIGDGLFDLAFDALNQFHQLRTGHFLAQQGLVADDDRGDHVRVSVGLGDQ
ncbi:hypothetical protein D3C84_592880 [compost metagenome]